MAVQARYTDKPISVNFSPGVREKLEAVAQRDGVSLNAVVRFAVESSVDLDALADATVTVPRSA